MSYYQVERHRQPGAHRPDRPLARRPSQSGGADLAGLYLMSGPGGPGGARGGSRSGFAPPHPPSPGRIPRPKKRPSRRPPGPVFGAVLFLVFPRSRRFSVGGGGPVVWRGRGRGTHRYPGPVTGYSRPGDAARPLGARRPRRAPGLLALCSNRLAKLWPAEPSRAWQRPGSLPLRPPPGTEPRRRTPGGSPCRLCPPHASGTQSELRARGARPASGAGRPFSFAGRERPTPEKRPALKSARLRSAQHPPFGLKAGGAGPPAGCCLTPAALPCH